MGSVKSKQEAECLPLSLGDFVTGLTGVNEAFGSEEGIFVFIETARKPACW